LETDRRTHIVIFIGAPMELATRYTSPQSTHYNRHYECDM